MTVQSRHAQETITILSSIIECSETWQNDDVVHLGNTKRITVCYVLESLSL